MASGSEVSSSTRPKRLAVWPTRHTRRVTSSAGKGCPAAVETCGPPLATVTPRRGRPAHCGPPYLGGIGWFRADFGDFKRLAVDGAQCGRPPIRHARVEVSI